MKNFKILNFLAGYSIPDGEKLSGKEVFTTHDRKDNILRFYEPTKGETVLLEIHSPHIILNDCIEIDGYVRGKGGYSKIIVFIQIA